MNSPIDNLFHQITQFHQEQIISNVGIFGFLKHTLVKSIERQVLKIGAYFSNDVKTPWTRLHIYAYELRKLAREAYVSQKGEASPEEKEKLLAMCKQVEEIAEFLTDQTKLVQKKASIECYVQDIFAYSLALRGRASNDQTPPVSPDEQEAIHEKGHKEEVDHEIHELARDVFPRFKSVLRVEQEDVEQRKGRLIAAVHGRIKSESEIWGKEDPLVRLWEAKFAAFRIKEELPYIKADSKLLPTSTSLEDQEAWAKQNQVINNLVQGIEVAKQCGEQIDVSTIEREIYEFAKQWNRDFSDYKATVFNKEFSELLAVYSRMEDKDAYVDQEDVAQKIEKCKQLFDSVSSKLDEASRQQFVNWWKEVKPIYDSREACADLRHFLSTTIPLADDEIKKIKALHKPLEEQSYKIRTIIQEVGGSGTRERLIKEEKDRLLKGFNQMRRGHTFWRWAYWQQPSNRYNEWLEQAQQAVQKILEINPKS